MATPDGPDIRSSGPRRRSSYAQRRERRAAVDDVNEVLDAAARYLEARPRSVDEVRRRLTAAGYRTELVETTIGRLVSVGYLDDEAFARAWVESRDRAHPRGELALRRELRLKGVEQSVIETVLDERRMSSDDGEPTDPDAAAARQLLSRHERALMRVSDLRRRRQRAYAMLARNGFAPDVCAAVATAWLTETGADSPS